MTTLRTKLLLFIIIAVTSSLLLSGLLTYASSSRLLLKESEDEINANAFRTGETIYGLLAAEIRNSEMLASQQVFRDTLRHREEADDATFFSPEFEPFLRATEALRGAYRGTIRHEKYWLGDRNGVVVASSEEKLETGSIRVPDRPYFIEAMQGRPAVSGTITSRANGKTIIVTAAPILDETGRAIGVIGNSIETSFFSEHLKGIRINERGKLYIVDAEGLILAHSTDESMILTKETNESILALAERPSEDRIVTGTFEFEDEGIRKYVAYSKIPFADWLVVVEDDIADIKSPLDELARNYSVVLLLAILASFLMFVYMLSRWVTRPLQAVMSVIAEVGRGNMDARVRIRAEDEFGVLGRTLNDMLENIADLMKAQERANRLQVENVSVRERSRLSEMLRHAMYQLSTSLDVQKVKRIALEELTAFASYDRVTVWGREDNGELTLNAFRSAADALPDIDRSYMLSLYETIERDERPIRTRRDGTDVYVLAVPFSLHGKFIGVKVLERTDREYEPEEAELVLSYCSQVVVAISNASLYAQMERMAVTDELTGMYNRRYFYRLAEERLEAAAAGGAPLSVVLFDIDHFKQVNDRWGHFVGDEVLRRLARIVEREAPSERVLARFGGEEFVLLLPGADGEAAERTAERLRVAVADAVMPAESGTLRVTISLGVAERRRGDRLDALLRRADEALYHAKSKGRNRVMHHA